MNALARKSLTAIYIGVSLALASTAGASPRADDDRNIVQRCQQSPQVCLEIIEPVLKQTQQSSRVWYQYKLLHLEALFRLVMFDELAEQVSPWVEDESVPLRFRINVLVYHAKILRARDANEEGMLYMERAISSIEQVNESNYDPLLTVMVANGLNSMGKYQQGYDLLMPLVKKYKHRPMAKFKHELFENLGHFAHRLGKPEEHLEFRLKALTWAQVLDNKNEIAISLYNIARAYQFLEKYEKAFSYFEKAEAMEAMGPSDTAMITFRRAEMSLAQGDISAAEQYMKVLADKPTFSSYQSMFKSLNQSIEAAKISEEKGASEVM